MTKYSKRLQFAILAAGICLAAILSISTPDSSATVPTIQNMRGVWLGFYQVGSEPPDPRRMEITAQENRRFTGFADPPEPGHTLSIEGTVSASGKVNYQGQSTESRVVGKSDLQDFGGGAAILDGSQTRIAVDGSFIVPCVLVMRSFSEPPGTVLPDAAGRYVGTLSGDGVTGQVDMRFVAPPDPVRPSSFPGTINITIAGETHAFVLLATVNSGGRIIAIGHKGTAGHLILDAVMADPPDPGHPTTLNGGFTLEFGDGSHLEGTFQTQVSVSTNS